MSRTETISKVLLFTSTLLAAYAFPLVAHLLQLRANGDLPDGAPVPFFTHGTGNFIFHLALLACCVSATGIFAGCVQTERSEAARMMGIVVVVAQGVACGTIALQGRNEMAECHEATSADNVTCRRSIAILYSLVMAIGTIVMVLLSVLASSMEVAAVEEEKEEGCPWDSVPTYTLQWKRCPLEDPETEPLLSAAHAVAIPATPAAHGTHYFVLTSA